LCTRPSVTAGPLAVATADVLSEGVAQEMLARVWLSVQLAPPAKPTTATPAGAVRSTSIVRSALSEGSPAPFVQAP
jgi:hypothetical protein